MPSLKSLRFVLATMFFFAAISAYGIQVEHSKYYVRHVTPYSQFFSNDEDVKLLIQATQNVMTAYVNSIKGKKLYPDKLTDLKTQDDIGKFEEANLEVAKGIMELNETIKRFKSFDDMFAGYDTSSFSLDRFDALPDALFIFGGFQVDASTLFGLAGKGSVNLGAVVMPVWVKEISIETGKVTEFWDVRISAVGWLIPGAGRRTGPQMVVGKKRGGAGFIWGDKYFTHPSQFAGGGMGISRTNVGPGKLSKVVPGVQSLMKAGRGINVKVGLLNNPNMERPVDFIYGSAAVEFGLSSEINPWHWNFPIISTVEAFVEAFGVGSDKAVQARQSEMERWVMGEMARQNGGRSRRIRGGRRPRPGDPNRPGPGPIEPGDPIIGPGGPGGAIADGICPPNGILVGDPDCGDGVCPPDAGWEDPDCRALDCPPDSPDPDCELDARDEEGIPGVDVPITGGGSPPVPSFFDRTQ